MSTGTTVQVIGAVVDVEFPAGQIPKVYDALVIDEADITLEVQQQLGDGVVRTIAMGSVGRPEAWHGRDEHRAARSAVPVGEKTLGRIMDVLGNPIDNAGDIGAEDHDADSPRSRRPMKSRQRRPSFSKRVSRSST